MEFVVQDKRVDHPKSKYTKIKELMRELFPLGVKGGTGQQETKGSSFSDCRGSRKVHSLESQGKRQFQRRHGWSRWPLAPRIRLKTVLDCNQT